MQNHTSRQFSPKDRHSFGALQQNDFTCEWAQVRELLRGLLRWCCAGCSLQLLHSISVAELNHWSRHNP